MPTISLIFFIEIVIALLLAAILFHLVPQFQTRDRAIHASFLRTPTGNTLVILGLLNPLALALFSYWFSRSPTADYSHLIAAITLLFLTLFLSIWSSFSLLKIASDTEIVRLQGKDRISFFRVIAIKYVFLGCGLFYLLLFCVFGLPQQKALEQFTANYSTISVQRPLPKLGVERDDSRRVLGDPIQSPGNPSTDTYSTSAGKLTLEFDQTNVLKSLTLSEK